jgi:hypothetical protein
MENGPYTVEIGDLSINFLIFHSNAEFSVFMYVYVLHWFVYGLTLKSTGVA